MLCASRSGPAVRLVRSLCSGAVVALVVAACSTSHSATVLPAGTVDPVFGSGGKLSVDLGSKADRAHAVVVTANGYLVIAGSTLDPAQSDNFALARFTSVGLTDPTFGDNGKVSTDFGGRSDVAAALAQTPDGKLVAAGTSHGTDTGDTIAVARYTADGRPDPSFGDNGKVSTDLGTRADHANAVVVQPDGRVVVTGSTLDAAQGDNFVVVRYTADGKPDPSFGAGGKVSTDFGGRSDIAAAVALESDGKLIVAGTSHGTDTGDTIAVARYTADGTLDASFGAGGKVSTDLGTKADHATAVAVQPDGRIVVAGSTRDAAQGDNFAVVRYTADGTLDPSFGAAGTVFTDFGGKSDTATGVAVGSDGRIVVAGTSAGTAAGEDIAVARYTGDGKLDLTFGTAGTVSTDFGSKADHGNSLAVQPDGRIVVAGSTLDPSEGDNVALVRYQN
ncbi:NHL repeat-containing protein [Nocardia stercoris]|uniref:Delta-60 repeat domain-containing protein n=1 Tax=Nocardia stercoris TaxID=2483361 RepID=A0A3M2L776_9NOCA|nr:hypothetical protein [Nocardia stercoris]RMI33501.1 hypothetical protein EBN03_10275 [Nocardia stercoris]